MTVRPARLNAAIAWLFMVGSACFVLGSVPAYVDAVGGPGRRRHLLRRLDLLHLGVVLPARAGAEPRDDRRRRGRPARARAGAAVGWLPHDRNWSLRAGAGHPVPGTLFFNISTLAALAHNADRRRVRPVRLAPRLLRVGALPRRQRLRHPRRVRAGSCGGTRRRCRGGSPGSTCSARCSSWPRRWPATSCPHRRGARHAAGGRRHPVRRRLLPRRRRPDVPRLAPRRSTPRRHAASHRPPRPLAVRPPRRSA